jgi:hypothetical protein
MADKGVNCRPLLFVLKECKTWLASENASWHSSGP